jgi:hypothetical protein
VFAISAIKKNKKTKKDLIIKKAVRLVLILLLCIVVETVGRAKKKTNSKYK